MAQLSVTDMRIPIQYAVSYPERLPTGVKKIDLPGLGALNFSVPDFGKFPCLELAFQAARGGGTMPSVLNAANEVCVSAFLDNKIGFVAIPEIIGKVMKLHHKVNAPSLNEILDADSWARIEAAILIAKIPAAGLTAMGKK